MLCGQHTNALEPNLQLQILLAPEFGLNGQPWLKFQLEVDHDQLQSYMSPDQVEDLLIVQPPQSYH